MTSRFACSGLDSREGRQRERERQGGEGQRHEEIELRSDDDHASRESPERLDKEFEGAPSCLAAGRCPPEDARAEPREPGERSRDLGRPAAVVAPPPARALACAWGAHKQLHRSRTQTL